MKNILFLTLILLFSVQVKAQEQTIDLLQKQLGVIETEEKNELREQIANINSMLENGILSNQEGERLKLKASEARARKIEERQAVILETISFLEQKKAQPTKQTEKDDTDSFMDIDSYFDKSVAPQIQPGEQDVLTQEPLAAEPQPEQLLPDKEIRTPTTLDLVVAMGLNNAIGKSGLEDIEEESDYSFYNSRFLEIGIALKTPLAKENTIRLKYGLSYQTNALKPKNNRYFREVNGQVQLEDNNSLTESRFNVNNLVIPIHLEFGPTKLKQGLNGRYYSAGSQLKIGVGGYGGINLTARQIVEYPEYHYGYSWLRRAKLEGYDVNRLVYGLSAYVGVGAFSIYGKYDLNTIFENGAKDQHFLAVGLRIDL
jgi:hypothetical protein